ncbi:MAG: MBL fold metallo-hydrolase [Gemmatimonadaceae bacterium]
MRLTTIGTGTAAPNPQRVQSGSLIEAGSVRLLVDCGSGVLWRMAQLGMDWVHLSHVAITHFHPDHCTDLVNLLMAWRYGLLPPRDNAVTLIGPPGFSAFIDRVAAAFFPDLRTLVPGTVVTELAPGDQITLGDDVSLAACKVPHTDESVGFGVQAGGRRIVCSGDTGFDAAFAEWATGADLLLLECSLPDPMAIPMHLTPGRCGAIAAIAMPGRLVLNHFYPPVEAIDIPGVVGTLYPGPVSLARDGQLFSLT